MEFMTAGIFAPLGFINNPVALTVLLLVVVLLFGGKNIPQLMKGLGEGMREFKKGLETEDTLPLEDSVDYMEREARMRTRIEQEVRTRIEAEHQEREKLRS